MGYGFNYFFDDTPTGRISIVMDMVYYCLLNAGSIADTYYDACVKRYTQLINECNEAKKENCRQLIDNAASLFCGPVYGNQRAAYWCNERNFKYEEINPTTVAPTSADSYSLTHVIIASVVCLIIGSLVMFLIMLVVCKKKKGNGNGGVEGGTTQGTTRTGTRGTTTRTGATKTRTGTTQL